MMFNDDSLALSRAKKAKEYNQSRDMAVDIVAEMLLDSDITEEAKLGVQVIRRSKKVIAAVGEIVEEFVGNPARLKPSDTETLKQVLEYLGLVEVGLKQFMETTKAPNANNAPNEI